jgi:hypothetical protein
MNCNMPFRKNLLFQDHQQGQDPCPICLETGNRMVQSLSECGHAMCTQCFKELRWPPHPIYLGPSEFGARKPPTTMT